MRPLPSCLRGDLWLLAAVPGVLWPTFSPTVAAVAALVILLLVTGGLRGRLGLGPAAGRGVVLVGVGLIGAAAAETLQILLPVLPGVNRLLALGPTVGFELVPDGLSYLGVAHPEGLLRFRINGAVLGLPVLLPALLVGLVAIRVGVSGVRRGVLLAACALVAALHAWVGIHLFADGSNLLSAPPPSRLLVFHSPWLGLAALLALRGLTRFGASVPEARPGCDGGLWSVGSLAVTAAVAGVWLLHGLLPGGPGRSGVVLFDDAHSDTWAPAARAMSFEWYGDYSTYNLAAFAEYLSYNQPVAVRVAGALDAAVLADCAVLVLKTPTVAFAPAEVAAVERFVADGGGLLLLGDHTDLLATSSHLNQIANCFGITFRSDFTRDAANAAFSLVRPTVAEVLPLARATGSFEFMTGCTLQITPGVRPVMIGRRQEVVGHDFADHNQFGGLRSDPSQPHGPVVLCAAAQHGRGRVLAFTDSTVLSGFALFRDERIQFFEAAVRWLVAGSRDLGLATGGLLVTAALCWVLDRVRRRRGGERAAPPLLLPVVLGILVGHGTGLLLGEVVTSRVDWARPPEGYRRPPVLAVPRTESQAWYPPVLGYSGKYEEWEYDSFFASWLRGGVFPREVATVADALVYDAQLVLNPRAVLTAGQQADLERWVAAGGRLIVAARNQDFAWEEFRSFVVPFDAELQGRPDATGRHYQVQFGRFEELPSPCGELWLGGLRHGRGLVLVAMGTDVWNTRRLGHCLDVPDRDQRAAHDAIALLARIALGDQVQRGGVRVPAVATR